MNSFVLLLRKDLLQLTRAKETLISSFGFALLVEIVAGFSFRRTGYGETELLLLTPGVIWLAFLFSAVIGLNQSFVQEEENKALLGVMLSPVSPVAVYLAKFCSNLLFVFCLFFFITLAHGLFFGVEIFSKLPLLLLLGLLESVGFVALGTLLAGIAVLTRGREIILPLMLFPLCLPLLAGAVFLTQGALESGSIWFGEFWFVLVCVFDVIALTCGVSLFEFTVEG